MRWIYLSPHLDDAVFSAGGLIYEQARAGIPVEVWTFMSGDPPQVDVSPFAQAIQLQWGFSSAEETVRMRREEDQRATSILGASPLHFDFLDCIYRCGANGEWLYSDVFVLPHPEDAWIPAQIAKTISNHLRTDDKLVCQLGLGSHVDHFLVRQGAELVGYPLLYDLDMPYFLYHPEQLTGKSAGMGESVHLVTESGLSRWQDAASAYKSQISGLGEVFDTPEKVRDSLQSYWAERQGLRLFGTE